ncbi:hypothetical protein AB4259_20650 [Vibrio amylolyticus]|uniref:hypothetical protein n=1 Tax=Vibrio amylolyticus TaxID=2847292 RepID=UPI00354ED43D
MKKTLLLAVTTLLTLAGCQSTSMSPEEEAISSNLCTTGDGSGAAYTMEAYKAAVMECGGYEIFTEDMLIDKTLSFAFNKGKKKRAMTLNSDGTAVYKKVEKGSSETINWTLTDQGNLRLDFDDGYAWDWTLMSESENYLAVKSMGWTADGSEKDILSMVVAVTAAMQ